MRRVAALSVALALMGCERGRTRNSGGGATLDEKPVEASTTNVYRFVGVEKALSDARKAAAEERWADAHAAATALLKQQPSNPEAKKIAEEADFEEHNQAS